MTADVKRCPQCGHTKPTTEFSRHKRAKDGFQSQCKACVRAYRQQNQDRLRGNDRRYYAANRDQAIKRVREWRMTNPGRAAENARQHRATNLQRSREYWATGAHGLTRSERDYIERMQFGCCAVCLDPLGTVTEIDHDHGHCPGGTSCGNCVRGVVHHRCNSVVDRFERGTLRDPELVELAAFYVAMTSVRMAPFYAIRTDPTATAA